MIDPDLLTIQRQRRQAGRCVQCGVPSGAATLCVTCRQHVCYCPCCEAIYRPRRVLPDMSRVCPACTLARDRRRRGSVPLSDHHAREQARVAARLRTIVAYYRTGMTYAAIAERLGMSRAAVAAVVRRARMTGRWPPRLKRRGEGWRKGRQDGPHPQLAAIITHYRRGATYAAIGVALGISARAVDGAITYARKTGRWPADLPLRGRGWRRARKEQPDADTPALVTHPGRADDL